MKTETPQLNERKKMSILPTDDAITRFKANEERIDIFVNDPLSTGYYTTNETVPRQVKTLPELADGIVESASLRADLVSNTAGKGAALVAFIGPDSNPHTVADLASDVAGKGDALLRTKQPFTGAIARTQHDKNRETVSVLDFGAVGNGIADDSGAFNAAISTGKPIHVPSGDYRINSPIVMVAGTTIFGEGRGTTRLIGGSNNLIILDTDQSGALNNNITLSDITLLGYAGYSGIVGIRLTKAAFFSAKSIYTSGGLDWVLKSYGTSGFSHITDLVMYQGNNGLYFYQSSNFVVMNSTLSTTYDANTFKGVDIDSYCDGIELNSINIEGSKYGVHIHNSAGGNNYPLSTIMTNVQAGANQNSTDGMGFWIESGSGIQLNNCIALSSAGNGMLIQAIDGVTLANTSCVNNGGYGVIVGASGVQIIGGIFGQNGLLASNTYSGISINQNLKNIVILGATCGAIGDYSNTQKYGIELNSGCSNIVIDNINYGSNLTRKYVFASLPNNFFTKTECFIATNVKSVSNTVTETSLIPTGEGLLTFPANWFIPGRKIRVKLEGYITNIGNPTIRYKLKAGSAVIFDSGNVTMATISGVRKLSIDMETTCRTTGSSGQVVTTNSIIYGIGDNTMAHSSTYPTTSNLDTTNPFTIDLTATWGTASTSNEIGISAGSVEFVL